MNWNVEYTDEFGHWWTQLCDKSQNNVIAGVELLEELGPNLRYPHSSGINGSRHEHMRELRIQCGAGPIRIFYAFDPIRHAILLIGGNKRGKKRFYQAYIPIADRLYDEHLQQLREEGLIK